jgi:hypothetical protein
MTLTRIGVARIPVRDLSIPDRIKSPPTLSISVG